MIEHVSRSEEQDRDKGDRGPEVAVLDYGQEVGGCDAEEGYEAQDGGAGECDFEVVDGPC